MTHPEMPPRRDTAPTQQLRDNNGMRGTCNSDCTLEEYASLYLEHVGAGEADRYLSNVASDLVQRHTSALFGNVSTLASQVEKAIEEAHDEVCEVTAIVLLLLLRFTGPPVSITARMRSTP
eukprot:7791443-Pyramimonas_sp.AAC.1